MSTITETPTNPTIYANAGTISAGSASAFRGNVNAYVGTVEDKAQLSQAYQEQLCAALGNGAIGGGAIAIGSGLNVTIAAATAIVGNYVRTDSTGTVGLTNGATNYIFFRQDGNFTANTTGAIPGTADNHGTALLWGSAVTSGGTVASVDNSRRGFLVNNLGTPVYSATNVTTDRSYDANSTTTDELADVLGTLISDLRAKGIVN